MLSEELAIPDSLILCNRMDDVSIFIYHRHSELLLIYGKHRIAIGWTTEHSAVDRLHRSSQRRGRVDHIVDRIAFLLDMLEIVNVATGINRHIIIFMEHWQEIFLHVESLILLLAGLGINRMMTYNDDPVFLGTLQS